MDTDRKNFSTYLKVVWSAAVFMVLALVIFFWLIASGKFGFMPTFDDLENPKSVVASEIITRDGQLLGKYFESENRTLIDYNDMNKYVVQALIATEDERFYRHSGIDLRGLFRVVKGVVTGDLSTGGGSTITQQLAKLLFPREDNTGFKLVLRKFREWVIAVKLERSYTKEEIITMYLNKFEFIQGAFGIEQAAQTYFNSSPDSLEMHQAAMLVGMLKNPWLYSPVRFEERAIQRRNVVLGQMLRNRYINQEQFDSTRIKPLDIDFQRLEHKDGMAPYFRKYLERTLNARKPVWENYKNLNNARQRFYEDSTSWASDPLFGWCNKNFKPDGTPYNINEDGLKIYTTLDYRMQAYAEQAVENHLKILQPQLDAHVRDNRNSPFSDDISDSDVQQNLYNEMRRSHRYRALREKGVSDEKIREVFNTPDNILIYTWDGYKDTIMSPLDSIKYYLRNLSSSFMAMEPETGEIRAWVGGSAYGFTEIDMVRSSIFKRQVGSTVKPFLYTLAMQNGLSPCLKVPNVEQSFILPDGTSWTAKNAGQSEHDGQMVTLRWGLANSVNQVSAWIMKRHNEKSMLEVMRRMGIYSNVPAYPSMFLGPAEITLYEMVAAYGVFANKGVYTSPIIVTHIEDMNGNTISNFSPRRHDAIDEETAYLMTNLLQNVISEGTGRRLMIRAEVFKDYGWFSTPFAGKTGTTQNQSDGWFVGFTPELVAGVWTGANYRSIRFSDLTRGQGTNTALPVFGRFFKQVFADSTLNYTEEFEFERPQNFNIDLDCNDTDLESDDSVPSFEGFW